MSLTGSAFLLFFVILLCFYYMFPAKAQWIWLLLGSILFFISAGGIKMVLYLVYGIVVAYTGARIIERSQGQKKRFWLLCLVVFLLISELVVLKYLFNLGNLMQSIFHFHKNIDMWNLAAPIGISYYTLSIMGYVFDVYYESYAAEKNFLKFSLFTCYFPQLVSGPVTKYAEMAPQMFQFHKLKGRELMHGVERMIIGYLKKCVIADQLGLFVQAVYHGDMPYSGSYLIAATIAYAFQLYADFSGCMDIVLGASQAFGITLPENFHSPFFSTTLSEFWRRWHITLGVWFKEYVFYPILKSTFMQKIGKTCKKKFGKKKGKKIPTYLGLICIWLAIGLWHGGTAMYFLASGIIPGIYLIGSEIFQPFFKWIISVFHINTNCISYTFFCRIRTVLLMCLCWIFVCAGSINGGIAVIKEIIGVFNPWILLDGSLLSIGWTSTMHFIMAFLGVILIIYLDRLDYNGENFLVKLEGQNIGFQCVFWWTILFVIMYFGVFGQSSFIYFQF